MSINEVSSESIGAKEKLAGPEETTLMNPVASGDSFVDYARRQKDDQPIIKPCCDGAELRIDEELVHTGLSAISIRLEAAPKEIIFTPGIVKHRNSFRNLHRPELRRVPCLQRLSPAALEALFRGHAGETMVKNPQPSLGNESPGAGEECLRVLLPTQLERPSEPSLALAEAARALNLSDSDIEPALLPRRNKKCIALDTDCGGVTAQENAAVQEMLGAQLDSLPTIGVVGVGDIAVEGHVPELGEHLSGSFARVLETIHESEGACGAEGGAGGGAGLPPERPPSPAAARTRSCSPQARCSTVGDVQTVRGEEQGARGGRLGRVASVQAGEVRVILPPRQDDSMQKAINESHLNLV